MVLQPKRLYSSHLPPWELEILHVSTVISASTTNIKFNVAHKTEKGIWNVYDSKLDEVLQHKTMS
jgi:hypothetical protein